MAVYNVDFSFLNSALSPVDVWARGGGGGSVRVGGTAIARIFVFHAAQCVVRAGRWRGGSRSTGVPVQFIIFSLTVENR